MKQPIFLALAFTLTLAGCDQSAKETAKPEAPAAPVAVQPTLPTLPEGMGVLPTVVPQPADNPTTAARVELGKTLYFEPALSKSGQFSCNSCHNLGTFGVDNQRFSIGHQWQRGGRNAPTVMNSGFWSKQFWDGRAPLLEDQAKGPPLNPVEMASTNEEEVIERLRQAGYEPLFIDVFGGGPETLTYNNLAKAIAAFERTLTTPNSAFDKYAQGKGDISEAAKRGMQKVAEVGCISCHSGPLFTNNTFQNFAYGSDEGLKSVTGKDEDDHVFRVQSWRNVAMTAPYFHDGSAATLSDAIRIMARVQLDANLSDAEVADIAAFLETLTGEPPKVNFPILPRPAGQALQWRD